MISPVSLFDALRAAGVASFYGVPDSLLKDFCAVVEERAEQHVIAVNEGAAIALAMGDYLASGQPALVYMQNSGLGNAVNPLTSLVDPVVYAIPMILVVGWRGEPGKKDEPQHRHMGAVSPALLDALEIPYVVLADELGAATEQLAQVRSQAIERGGAVAVLVRKGTFDAYAPAKREPRYPLTREAAIEAVAGALGSDAVIVSTTGKPSRELFEHRVRQGQAHNDFLTVGGMGHASQIALGVALRRPARSVVCFDGDGAVLMHMGALATIGALAPPTFRHVVLNNGAHDSVGGQPTLGFDVDLPKVAEACGYRAVFRADSAESLALELPRWGAAEGPCLLEVRVRKGARKDLGRPTETPIACRDAFVTHATSGEA